MGKRGPKGRPLPTRAEFVSQWEAGVRKCVMAKRYGVSWHTIARWAQRFGLRPRHDGSEIDRRGRGEELKALWRDPAESRDAIANRLGVSRKTVTRWAWKMKLGDRPEPDVPEGDPNEEEIVELAAYARARRIMSRKGFNFEDGEVVA